MLNHLWCLCCARLCCNGCSPRPQGVPQWTCLYAVSGGGSATAADVAAYLASTVSAGGQEFCSGQPGGSGFCDPALGITGLCAASPAPAAGSPSFCRLMPTVGISSSSWTMTTVLAAPGNDCPTAGRKLSVTAQSSLLDFLGGYMPGFALTLPQAKKTLQCVQQWVSAPCCVQPVRACISACLQY